jgi:hypothetical protein
MARRVNKKEVNVTECHICKKSGKSFQIFASHNFRDLKGRIVCDSFLKKMSENKCSKCNGTGHFSDRCSGYVQQSQSWTRPIHIHLTLKENKIENKNIPVSKNVFSILDNDDEEDKPHPNVTIRKPVSAKTMCWADFSDDEDDDDPTPFNKFQKGSLSFIKIRSRSPSPF